MWNARIVSLGAALALTVGGGIAVASAVSGGTSGTPDQQQVAATVSDTTTATASASPTPSATQSPVTTSTPAATDTPTASPTALASINAGLSTSGDDDSESAEAPEASDDSNDDDLGVQLQVTVGGQQGQGHHEDQNGQSGSDD